MGRVSLAGLCLADFLPAGQAVDMALRAVAVFHAHGDRQNRNQARLRFVRQRVGDAAFAELFRQTPAASVRGGVPAVAEADTCLPPGFAAVAEGFDACGAVRGKPPGQEEGGGRNAPLPEGGDAEGQAFDVWHSLAVSSTRFGDTVRMVRLFVPYGNLTAAQLRYVADLAEGAGSPFVRIMPSQDILLPFVSERAIPCLYGRLSQARNGIDLTCGSLRGHVVTCVGASLCRIGMADAPRIGDRIAAALDAALLPADTPEKRAMLRLALGGIRISGCFNACAGHPAAAIGIGCLLRKIDGEVRAFGRILTGARTADGRVFLSEPVTEEIPEEQLPEAVLERLRRFAADSRNMV